MPVIVDAAHREVAGLYNEHHRWLSAWLRNRLGDAHQAADIAHDIFVRLLAREMPVEAREPRAFLTTVAQRALFSHYRRQQLERAYLDALAHWAPTLAASPEERAILLETLVEIDRMLDGLPALVRRAFLLSQLDGLKQAEIAQELNISLATVKRYLVKAGMHCMFAVAP
ncbi:sigma-70 family RNA polymerase sigma factor [Pantoea sp. 18069]|uniref:sigma-70 family RNA polymerase sigma factor n=1 Tax=Pantoea sp. 18069 TaxID=2681415 RepID=UPI00135BD700|nr:sigma-70 family RNA polymerase sigma factor [Pantoea sp. 18069]